MEKPNMQSDLDLFLNYLVRESPHQGLSAPRDESAKLSLMRALMNIRPADRIPSEMLEIQDRILRRQNNLRGRVDPAALARVGESLSFPMAEKLVLWQGDITTLAADAIVNAANAGMLGCFVPLHKCIDNAIHSAAGIQLRLECYELMQRQGHPEAGGRARLTRAYNLPSRFVIHTVGPMVEGAVTDLEAGLLADCYRSCLEAARHQGSIKSLAFCSISTGEFHFPTDQAASIAIETVCDWLGSNPEGLETVIWDVFSREDFDRYNTLFQKRASRYGTDQAPD
jgi:O-acetyl-ADP-ribose deacetylase (regulator of RNase III)